MEPRPIIQCRACYAGPTYHRDQIIRALPEKRQGNRESIVKKHLFDCEVRAFGSRVQGNAKPFSDLDLVVLHNGKLDERRQDALREDLSLSDLPIMVEWADISESFKTIIDQKNKFIQKRSKRGEDQTFTAERQILFETNIQYRTFNAQHRISKGKNNDQK